MAEPSSPIPVEEIKRENAVDFSREIVPILRDNCQACHNATKAKAGLILESPASILKGGDSGPAVIPGKGTESLLLKAAAHLGEPFMPPSDNKVSAKDLTPPQLGLLKLWIDQGATGVVAAAAPPLQWQPLPAGFVPINAVALSQDGQFAACGRANQIFLYELPGNSLADRLSDPALSGEFRGVAHWTGTRRHPRAPALSGEFRGVAHRDLVQSLAFSPDGNRLASGGYRVIKLWRREPIERGGMPGINGAIQTLAASPDRKWLAAGMADNTLMLFNSAGERVRPLGAHPAGIRAACFSPDGARVATVSKDKTVRVWSAADGQLLLAIDAGAEMNAVAWISSGAQIAAAGADHVIKIWDAPQRAETAQSPVPRWKWVGHHAEVTALEALAPDGKQLISASRDGSARIWSLEKGEVVRRFEHGAPVTAIAVRADGKRLLTAGENQISKLWNLATGELIAELKGNRYLEEELARRDRTVSFHKSEAAFQKSAFDNAEKQRRSDEESLKKANEAKAGAEKVLAEKEAAAKKASSDKEEATKNLELANASLNAAKQNQDTAARLAELSSKQAEAAAELSRQTAALLKSADQARETAYQNLLKLAAEAQKDGQSAEKRAAAELAAEQFTALKAALESTRLAREAAEKNAEPLKHLAKQNQEAKAAAEKNLADAAKRQKEFQDAVQRFEKQLAEAGQALDKAKKEKAKADDVAEFAVKALQQAEKTVADAKEALASAEQQLKQAESDRAATAKAEQEARGVVRAVAFSPDNRLAVTSDEKGQLLVWNADNGGAYDALKLEGAQALVFLDAATLLAAGETSARLNLRREWKLERVIGAESDSSPIQDRVLALDFSPDGRLIASGGGMPSRSGEIKIWNVSDGSMVRDFKEPHSDTVYALKFSADQKWLASGGADKFARVFEVDSGKLARSFEGHTHHVLGVSWKRDGRTLATAGADKVIKIWNTLNGDQRKTIDGFGKEITSIHFIDASNEALISSGDSQVRLVREDGNNNIRTFAGAADFIAASDLTPDGRIVIAGGQDGVLRVWNGTTGKLVAVFEPPKDQPGNLAARTGN